MSVRFYNTTGWMIGVDLHMFLAAAPPEPLPVPILFHPHVVIVKLSWGICGEKSKLANVTSDGAAMLQKGHALKMVPHIFVPSMLPHPAEAAEIALVTVKAKTTCVMAVASVTGGGEPLATCLAGWWGLNVNCGSPVDRPSGHVFNGNTVRTTPALADYVNAGLDVVLGAMETVLEEILPGRAKEWFKKFVKGKKLLKKAEKVLKHLLKDIDKTVSLPSDLAKKIDKKREELVRELLGGH